MRWDGSETPGRGVCELDSQSLDEKDRVEGGGGLIDGTLGAEQNWTSLKVLVRCSATYLADTRQDVAVRPDPGHGQRVVFQQNFCSQGAGR